VVRAEPVVDEVDDIVDLAQQTETVPPEAHPQDLRRFHGHAGRSR
jgi:hypothetical protein